ncbi:MAG: hypothetical protein ABIF04_00415 [Chloroflexota bacterium]
MNNNSPVWETIHYSDTQFQIRISIESLKNILGQLLTDLMNNYKFYYAGLNISEEGYSQFKHNVELNLVLSEKYGFDTLKQNAKHLLATNYLKDLNEIIIYGLTEVCLITFLLDQRNKGYSKSLVDSLLEKQASKYKREHLPGLVEIVRKDIGDLIFEKHISSINSVRRCLVHRNGYVESESLSLITRVPKLFTDTSLSRKDHILRNDDKTFVDYVRKWNRNEKVKISYEDCFRIQNTILHFFTDIVSKLVDKFPDLKI